MLFNTSYESNSICLYLLMVTHGKECISCILTTIYPASFFSLTEWRVWAARALTHGNFGGGGVDDGDSEEEDQVQGDAHALK